MLSIYSPQTQELVSVLFLPWNFFTRLAPVPSLNWTVIRNIMLMRGSFYLILNDESSDDWADDSGNGSDRVGESHQDSGVLKWRPTCQLCNGIGLAWTLNNLGSILVSFFVIKLAYLDQSFDFNLGSLICKYSTLVASNIRNPQLYSFSRFSLSLFYRLYWKELEEALKSQLKSFFLETISMFNSYTYHTIFR